MPASLSQINTFKKPEKISATPEMFVEESFATGFLGIIFRSVLKSGGTKPAIRSLAIIGALFSLSACANMADRLSQVGEAPPLTQIQNPQTTPNYRPVSLPMPATKTETAQPNSLWAPGHRSFFKDQRASQVGDILTVTIEINDKAEMANETDRSRENSEAASLPNFLGLESDLHKILPDAVDPTSLVDASSDSGSKGKGSISRNEKITLKVAAIITQLLPNGNFVIDGKQEVRVNYEVRDLLIAGVVRPEDIDSDNTISYDKIAEARISYGGRGQITDVQQPRYGQQIYDILFPF